MDPIGPYVSMWRELVARHGEGAAADAFVGGHGFVLVKRPVGGDVTVPSADPTLSFATVQIDFAAVEALGALAPKWLVVPLSKAGKSAFTNRLSVGRATNCDVVLRFSFVSKLQGHIMLTDGLPTSYVDYGGANPGRLNGVALGPRVRAPLAAGHRLSIGPLELELCDPGRFLHVVRNLAAR